jgi:outer membrane protein assembly factor BamB
MAETDVLIDLGYADDFTASDADWPARSRERWRTTVVVLLLVAIVTLVADAAPPRLELLLTVSAPPGGTFDLTDDALYAVSGSPPTTVVGYGLPGGGRRWELDSQAGALLVSEVGRVVLAMGQYCSQASAFQTVALDAHSGVAVWKRPGVVIFEVAGAQTVILKRPPEAGTCDRLSPWLDPSDAGLPVIWDAVDVTTGAVLWSLPVAAGVLVRAAYDNQGGAQWLVELRTGGEVTTRDLRTGQALITGRLPELSGAGSGSRLSAQPLSAVGDLVVATYTSVGGTLYVGGYARDSLERRWLATVPPTGSTSTRVGYRVTDCGSSICLENGTSLVVLDSRTGQLRWRSSGAFFARSNANGLLGGPSGVLGASGGGGPSAAEPLYQLIDTATGRSRLDLAGWQARVGSHQPSQALLSMYVGGRTWFERLNTATARVAVLGSTPGRYAECAANARYLACATVTGTIRVWHLAASGED